MSVRSDRFLPAMLFLLFLPSRCTLMEKLTPPSILPLPPFLFLPLSFSPFFPFSFHLHLLLRAVPPLCPPPRHRSSAPTPPLRSPYSLVVGKPQSTRPCLTVEPSTIFMLSQSSSRMSFWLAHTERDRREEREEEVTLLCLYFFIIALISVCMVSCPSVKQLVAVAVRGSVWN